MLRVTYIFEASTSASQPFYLRDFLMMPSRYFAPAALALADTRERAHFNSAAEQLDDTRAVAMPIFADFMRAPDGQRRILTLHAGQHACFAFMRGLRYTITYDGYGRQQSIYRISAAMPRPYYFGRTPKTRLPVRHHTPSL